MKGSISIGDPASDPPKDEMLQASRSVLERTAEDFSSVYSCLRILAPQLVSIAYAQFACNFSPRPFASGGLTSGVQWRQLVAPASAETYCR